MSSFALNKWYLDCIADDGETRIVYVASLRIGAMTVGYQSVLALPRTGEPSTRTSFRTPALPEGDDGALTWEGRPLRAHGRWTRTAKPIERTVIDVDDGAISWHCVAPASTAEVADDGVRVSGLGYVERLEMTLPPWRMPIDELWWGRFVSADAALVWIDWRGSHRFRTAVLDGQDHEDALIDDDGVRGSGFSLTFSETVSLRQGTLGSTALAMIPTSVREILPGRVLFIDERKWRSRGTLIREGRSPVEGWVIHEVVRWP